MPHKPPAQNPSPKRVDPRVARPSPLLVALAARFHLTAWEQEYGGECFTVTASDRVGQKPTVSIDGLHRDHCKEDAVNTARVVRVLRELADLIERCEAEEGPAPAGPDVGSAGAYSALMRLGRGNEGDDEDGDDDDQEHEEADQQLAELQLLIEEEALAELPPGCEWHIQRKNLPDEPGPALLLLDARPSPEAGHVGDGTITKDGEAWRWSMQGTASYGATTTPEAAAYCLAEYAWGRIGPIPLEPPKRSKGRPKGSKNRPKPPPPEQAALPESGPPEVQPEPPPAPPVPERTPVQFILERFELAGGSLDPRILPEGDAAAVGEATAKGWIRALSPLSDGTAVCYRLTDAGWEELERLAPGGTLGRTASLGEP